MNAKERTGCIVFVVAHPDDVAHAMGGTAFLLRKKYRLHVLCASKGERGIKSKTPAEAAAIREPEEAAACRRLNARLTFLGQTDGEVFADGDICRSVAGLLRKLRPKAVFTLWPINRHPDHVAVYNIATKAVQLAGLSGSVELYMGENALEVTNQFNPDILVDISEVIEEKKELIRMHHSQNPGETHVDKVLERNAFRGRFAGVEYAEGFKTLLPLTVRGTGGINASVLLALKRLTSRRPCRTDAQGPQRKGHDMFPKKHRKTRPPDAVIVFAPHPDDESLGCAGVIMRAKRSGGRVRVVFLTNGDGFSKAAAMLSGKDIATLTAADFLTLGRARQQSALAAARVLSLSADDLVFLGYPDGGLAKISKATGDAPYVQKFTRKDSTYGLIMPDYHTLTHGTPAPYLRAAMPSDVTELLQSASPNRIYVTAAADGHADHQAACGLVCAAAATTGFRGELYTYLIHAGGGRWPWPSGATPDAPFEAHVEDGKRVPEILPWPPDDRQPMTRTDAATKLEAIHAYTVEMQLAKDYIESFVKSEEIFWRWSL